MGGCLFHILGQSEAEAEAKADIQMAEARFYFLYEENRTPAEWCPEESAYRVLLKVHS